MADYTLLTNYERKDALPHADPEKIVSGTELQAEFQAIASAIASKAGTSFDFINALTSQDVYQSFADVLFPVGFVTMFYGLLANIPDGWALCDGTNGTPDLRGRFVIGAGGSYAKGATGGAASGTTSSDGGGTTGATTLTANQMPAHTHHVMNDQIVGSDVWTDSNVPVAGESTAGGDSEYDLSPTDTSGTWRGITDSTGGGAAHDHTIASHTHTVATLPPYYGLYYIMYVGFDTGTTVGSEEEPVVTTLQRFSRGATWATPGPTLRITVPVNDVNIRIPIDCTIKRVTVLTVNGPGSCVVDIWSDAYGNYPPTVADTICAAAKPTISNGVKYEDSTLTGWNTAVTAGSVLTFHLESCSTFQNVFIEVEFEAA